jgi:hypothetical protein
MEKTQHFRYFWFREAREVREGPERAFRKHKVPFFREVIIFFADDGTSKIGEAEFELTDILRGLS